MRALSSPLPYLITSSPPLMPALTVEPAALDVLPLLGDSDDVKNAVVTEPEILPNRFEEMLPRELQLQCIKALILICDEDHVRDIRDGRWTVFRACQERWVGSVKGYREIIKLSRVSHAWRSLAFDGQLWSALDLAPYSHITKAGAYSLISAASPFIKHASILGLPRLFPILARSLTAPYAPGTQLRSLNLRGCRHIKTGPLHLLISTSPMLESVNFCASAAVTNFTTTLLAAHCPELKVVNVNRCPYLSGSGIIALGSTAAGPLVGCKPPRRSKIRELRIAGLRYANVDVLRSVGEHMPDLEVLDMSGSRLLGDSAIEALVTCTKDSDCSKVALTSREAGHDPAEMAIHYRRLTKLRHLNLSSCPEITDRACSHLAHAVPNLEFLELADLGGAMKDDGLVHLLETAPHIRKLDLDDAMDITDSVLDALTPPPPDGHSSRSSLQPTPGEKLEHIILSYATNLTNEGVLRFIRGCPKLRILEVDNTRVSDSVLREFVRIVRKRKTAGAEMVAVDCRSVGKAVVSELAQQTRPRRGWKAWEAQAMNYDDGSPHNEAPGPGPSLTPAQDECDETKVVLKSFWSWQAVDTAAALRERRKRIAGNRRYTEGDLQLAHIAGRGRPNPDLVRQERLEGDGADGSPTQTGESRRRSRWVIRWSGGRGGTGGSMYVGTEPAVTADNIGDERSCVIM
ncbi:RNI-like protein [Dacryopinax primogenitus]|uniref:RNI-like protein n=1 Tax=Dacryopinax primogenitus (strain DJM 731) TaxID=1858805 RepID=M5FUZ1_DACPD|nr:RNI-like protein [Dacryopinax primogenitus]EJU00074.1 RNI-like protein [Dacryopinax primogenitus]